MEKVEAIIAALLLAASPAFAQRVEPVPFGDFEQWTRREIKESGILGGNVRTIYVIGPEETIVGNKVYDYSRTIWASSNAYARVAGITKTSVTVEPAQGPDGLCARLTTRFAECKVAGVVNISVLATGSIYWGRMLEPVTGVKDPFSMMDWGIPFTGKPSALLLDISAQLPNTGKLVRGTTFSHKEFPGEDPCQILLLLQHRWEDADGNIHALRVGTAIRRIGQSTDGWVQNMRVPVVFGDYTPLPNTLYAVNSRGERKPILEEGRADENTPVTHAILQISAGSCGAFTGALGNTLDVDNIRLEYD
ncbi:MAG: PCMD domain-containing protein [Bacteroidales bacterium]|nr:PCMD domain-containing protein [Bacteroidales bacterium]